ncbi:MAG: thiamine phosphate synthase [Gammaproteobacteria bacterium]|nr:thiamine phosphate synthase [Gammaproteobacteria bacterium]
MGTHHLQGLYAITDESSRSRFDLEAGVEAAIRGGARLVQYRDKTSDRRLKLHEANALRRVCHDEGALFIVNDDVDLALASGADGVHLGANDTALDKARRHLGKDAIIGVSCYGDLDRARSAAAAGADYLAFGALFMSQTKPDAPTIELDIFAQTAELGLPCCGIGGITTENAPAVMAAGAQMIAVVKGLFDVDSVTAVENNARQYARAISRA